MKVTIEKIRQENKGKFASVSKFLDGNWVAFHRDNSVTGICKTKKECIEQLTELGYTYTTSNLKSQK